MTLPGHPKYSAKEVGQRHPCNGALGLGGLHYPSKEGLGFQ
jgi:hypothetical protein